MKTNHATRQVSFRQIRFFLCAAHYLSLSATAQRVSRTQTAISKALSALESSTEEKLLDRFSTGVRLSAAGKIFAHRAFAAAAQLNLAVGLPRPSDLADLVEHYLSAPDHPMNLSNSNLFSVIAVEHGRSWTTAGNRLNISAAAVRKAVRESEQRLDTVLFLRAPHHAIMPTTIGRRFVQHGKLAIAEISIGLDELRSMRLAGSGRQAIHGQITVGSVPFVRTSILPRAIAAFANDHAHITLSTREAPYDEQIESLRTGELDLIVGPLDVQTIASDLELLPFVDAPVGLVVRADHPAVRGAEVNKPLFESLSWVLPPPGSPSRTVFETMMQSARVTLRGHHIETSSYAIRRGLLLESDFAAVSPLAEFYHDVKGGLLRTFEPGFANRAQRAAMSNASHIVVRAHSRLSPAAAAFLDYVLRAQKH